MIPWPRDETTHIPRTGTKVAPSKCRLGSSHQLAVKVVELDVDLRGLPMEFQTSFQKLIKKQSRLLSRQVTLLQPILKIFDQRTSVTTRKLKLEWDALTCEKHYTAFFKGLSEGSCGELTHPNIH